LIERLVRDIYHRGVIFCKPDTPLQEVVQVMVDTDIHAIIVTDGESPEPLGVVSHTDIISHYGKELSGIKASEVMTPHVITIPEDKPVSQASNLMLEHNIRRLLVTEEGKNTPLGIISTTDIIREMRGTKWVWQIG
jgi:CBS domain-containing protein